MNTCGNDEIILGHMCNEIHGLPDFSFRYRPMLGIHFSPGRGIGKKMDLITNKKHNDIFCVGGSKKSYTSLRDLTKYCEKITGCIAH